MGDDGFVRSAAAGAAAFEQGGMEPAAMLVGAFEVDVGRPMKIVALLQNEGMGAAGFEPDIENVVDLFPIGGIIDETVQKTRMRTVCKPRIRTLALEDRGDLLVEPGVTKNFAARFIDEDGDRHAPGALAGDHPIRPRLDHAADAIAALRGYPVDLVNRGERLLAQAMRGAIAHGNEPLRGIAKDDRLLRAPGMGILVLETAPCNEHAG